MKQITWSCYTPTTRTNSFVKNTMTAASHSNRSTVATQPSNNPMGNVNPSNYH